MCVCVCVCVCVLLLLLLLLLLSAVWVLSTISTGPNTDNENNYPLLQFKFVFAFLSFFFFFFSFFFSIVDLHHSNLRQQVLMCKSHIQRAGQTDLQFCYYFHTRITRSGANTTKVLFSLRQKWSSSSRKGQYILPSSCQAHYNRLTMKA